MEIRTSCLLQICECVYSECNDQNISARTTKQINVAAQLHFLVSGYKKMLQENAIPSYTKEFAGLSDITIYLLRGVVFSHPHCFNKSCFVLKISPNHVDGHLEYDVD